MVLPEGTTCHDISTTGTRAFDYIKDNAVRSWPFISIFAQSRRYPTANGSPYVITGVDKTSAYANLAFPNRPPSVEIFATYQNEVLDPMERMSTAAREATADETLSPTPTIYVFSCEAYELRSAEPNGLKMSIKGAEAHLYTEIFVDRPPSRLRLPFLITVIQFDKDEQALSLNDKSFFSVVGIPFLICTRITYSRLRSSIHWILLLFCMVNESMPLSKLSLEICRSINTMQLRLWSTIPFGLFYLKRCLTEVQRDALMFTCSKSCSSDYFCSMFNDVFDLYKVVNSQGELVPLFHSYT